MKLITKNNLLLTGILFLLSSHLTAQAPTLKADVNWGPFYTEPANTTATKIIATTPEGFYVLREKILNNPGSRPKVFLEYFNRDMKLVKSVEQELKYKKKQRDFEDILMIGGELYLMTSYNNEAKKQNYLFKQKISRRSLLPSKTMDMVAATPARNKEREGTFDYHVSTDSSKLLIYNQLPYSKNQPEQFALRVYNNQFEEIWDKNVVMPYPDNQLRIEEYRVDNEGNIYLLGVLFKDGAGYRRRGTPNYEYVILAYTNNGENFDEYRVDLKGKFITDLTFRVIKGGDLVCAGFYSEKNSYSVKGTYYFRLNAVTKEIYNQNTKEFEFRFLADDLTAKQANRALDAERSGKTKNTAELYQYSLDDLITRSDGGAVLIAEQFYVEERDDFNRFNTRFGFNDPFLNNQQIQRDYYYNYNDIIIVNIRPNGEIEWTARIPKRQETVNDGGYYSSYTRAIVRDRMYFVFNDNPRNYDGSGKSNRQYNFSGNRSIVVAAEVMRDGKVSLHPVLSNQEAAVIARPKICKQIGRNEMAIFGESGRDFRFASMKFGQ